MSQKTLKGFENLPEFSSIHMETVLQTLESILNENKESIDELARQASPDWNSLIDPIMTMQDRLNRFWSPIRHLHSVMNDEAVRQVYSKGLAKLSQYYTELGQHEGLFKAYKAIEQSTDFNALSTAQKRSIKNNLRDFRLSGIDLPGEQQDRYKEISLQLSQLKTQFEQNILDCTDQWSKLVTDKTRVNGIPQSDLIAAQQRAEKKGESGWLFNLEFPSYHAVITYADDRELRREVYQAFVTRASDQGPHESSKDNKLIIDEILSLRAEEARLLGFETYADLSLFTKMAESPQDVLGFLQQLVDKSKPQATLEVDELKQFVNETDPGLDLQAWDVAYYSNKLKQAKHDISEKDLKPYFPAQKVIPGMFKIVEKLFGIRVKIVPDVDTYHPDVDFYQIVDLQGKLRGGFYLDSYARDKKRGGAWMDVCISRKKNSDNIQLPVAYLTCNLTPPIGEEVALFTHNEVITLFHEFGHGLHHMLTQVDVQDVSGISGVEWDAVELPSQFLENWCWDRDALEYLSGHYQTGDAIPQDLLEKAYAAKNFQSGLMMLRQLEFAIFDMRLHVQLNTEQSLEVQKLLDEVREEVALLPQADFNRFQNSFSHIFAGGYAAGYYSYKWAEVLSADAFSKFEEDGVFNEKTGREFLNNILEKGGTEKAMDLFKNFRGREPKIDALLKHSGLAA